jgi:hypothetical protein
MCNVYNKHFLIRKRKYKGAYNEATEVVEHTFNSTDTGRSAAEGTEFVMQGG